LESIDNVVMHTTTTLTENGLTRKPNVAYRRKWHALTVAREKKIHYLKAKSALQAVFVRRVNQVMKDKGLSDNAIAKIMFPENPSKRQTSVSRITACRQDPSLQKVQEIADALNVHPLFLFMEVVSGSSNPQSNIAEFPPAPSMLGVKEEKPTKKRKRRH
jgi:transcriptional regulator with XRE-family HTH domain